MKDSEILQLKNEANKIMVCAIKESERKREHQLCKEAQQRIQEEETKKAWFSRESKNTPKEERKESTL